MNNHNAVQVSLKKYTSVLLLENLIHPDNKVCQLKELIDWSYLDNKLGHLFQHENAPSSRLMFGLLYLQSIGNLSYSEVVSTWRKSPEWQYFCGEKFFSETYPLNSASLSIWSRVVGEKGRISMTYALINDQKSTLH